LAAPFNADTERRIWPSAPWREVVNNDERVAPGRPTPPAVGSERRAGIDAGALRPAADRRTDRPRPRWARARSPNVCAAPAERPAMLRRANGDGATGAMEWLLAARAEAAIAAGL